MTKLVGILNITPDSFSDGKKYNTKESALFHLQNLIAQGADIIDVGAESTRPGANPITCEEEWQRLENILPELINYVKEYNKNNNSDVEISLDSRYCKNIERALKLGIDIINDVTGFEAKEIIDLAVKSGKKIVVMHNLGVPADKNKIVPENLDVIEVIIDWMRLKLSDLIKSGVKKGQIIFDPGIGFGKNAVQSIKILKDIDRFRVLDLPLFIGHSKKSFLEDFFEGSSVNNREDKTILISKYLAKRNVEYLRVHDVAENKKVLQ